MRTSSILAEPGALAGPIEPLVEVAWRVEHRGLRADHGYALFAALCRIGVIDHGLPNTIVLPLGRYLVLRVPRELANVLARTLMPDRLDVGGAAVDLIAPAAVRPILPAPSLRARLVVIAGMTDDASLRAAALRQMAILGMCGRCDVLKRGVLHVARRAVVGYGVRVCGLSDRDSLVLQSRGLGGKLRMGCGGFIPC